MIKKFTSVTNDLLQVMDECSSSDVVKSKEGKNYKFFISMWRKLKVIHFLALKQNSAVWSREYSAVSIAEMLKKMEMSDLDKWQFE
jgi:hypothetical protein